MQVRTDQETEQLARDAFESMGMDLSTGINIFLHQVVNDGGMPFTPSAANTLPGTLADALVDVKAGRVEHFANFADYLGAMDKL